jgi:hypothetical protein
MPFLLRHVSGVYLQQIVDTISFRGSPCDLFFFPKVFFFFPGLAFGLVALGSEVRCAYARWAIGTAR